MATLLLSPSLQAVDWSSDDAPSPFEVAPDGSNRLRPPVTLTLGLGLAAFRYDPHQPIWPTLTFDSAALIHFRWLTIGFAAGATWAPWAETGISGSIVAGPGWNLGRGRLQVLFDFGIHEIRNIGDGFFVQKLEAGSAALPNAGLALSYAYVTQIIPLSSTSSLITVDVFAHEDLARRGVRYQDQSCFLGCSVNDTSTTIGGWIAGARFNAGIMF